MAAFHWTPVPINQNKTALLLSNHGFCPEADEQEVKKALRHIAKYMD